VEKTSFESFCDFDQVVIYGAKGWLGRSAIDALHAFDYDSSRLLLVGSKSEKANEAELPVNIFSAEEAIRRVSNKSLFINAAYLRREKLQEMSVETYLHKIDQINEFPRAILKAKRLRSFINLSSGAAAEAEDDSGKSSPDAYSKSKLETEELLRKVTSIFDVPFINCRVFSISGKYINEFNNLALSSFIQQAKSAKKRITVFSPTTFRTYVDSVDLMNVLIRIAFKPINLDIDSGGWKVTMLELAKEVSNFFPGSTVEKMKFDAQGPDFCATTDDFNHFAAGFGIHLKSISEQVKATVSAFA